MSLTKEKEGMNISELQLWSADIRQTQNFYQDVLGMEILDSSETRVTISAGRTLLHFINVAGQKPFYHFAFTIPANQFNEALQWASGKLDLVPVSLGNPVADFKSWNAKAFYFYDNNKNIVELIARFDLPEKGEKKFDGTSIFSISEIGLVVDDAMTYSLQLFKDHDLHFFTRQAPSDDFVAIGDDHGLFIVVNENRNWYPTNRASKKYWTKVNIELNGKLSEIELYPGGQ